MSNTKNTNKENRSLYPLCFLFATKKEVNKSIDNIMRRKFYNSKINGLDFTNKLHMLVQ